METRRKFRIRHMGCSKWHFFTVFLDEVIYVEQPHLFEIDIDKVCKIVEGLVRTKLPIEKPSIYLIDSSHFKNP